EMAALIAEADDRLDVTGCFQSQRFAEPREGSRYRTPIRADSLTDFKDYSSQLIEIARSRRVTGQFINVHGDGFARNAGFVLKQLTYFVKVYVSTVKYLGFDILFKRCDRTRDVFF